MRELRPAARQQQACQLLERFTGKEVSVTTRYPVQLLGDCCVDLAVAVSDAEGGRAARAVQVSPSVSVVDIAALAPDDARQCLHPPPDRPTCGHSAYCPCVTSPLSCCLVLVPNERVGCRRHRYCRPGSRPPGIESEFQVSPMIIHFPFFLPKSVSNF